MDYAALKTKIGTYAAGTTDAAILADITGETVAITVDVPIAMVMNTFMTRGVWPAIELLSREAKSAVAAHDNALAASVALVRLVTATPDQSVKMTDATTNQVVQSELAALVAFGTIAQADSDAVLALASAKTSWASQNGCSDVRLGDIATARVY